jgi:hypothetical protein
VIPYYLLEVISMQKRIAGLGVVAIAALVATGCAPTATPQASVSHGGASVVAHSQTATASPSTSTPAAAKPTGSTQIQLVQQFLGSRWSDPQGGTLVISSGGTGRLDMMSSGCPLPPKAPHTCQILAWVRLVSISGKTATLKVTEKIKVTVFTARPGMRSCIEQGGSPAVAPKFYHLRVLDNRHAVLTGDTGTSTRTMKRGAIPQPPFCV